MKIKSDRGNVMSDEKREFGGWWIFSLILVVLTIVILTVTGYMGKLVGVNVERAVFEQSYQKQAGDSKRLSTYRAQLAQINSRLLDESNTDIIRELKAQKAMLEVQINSETH